MLRDAAVDRIQEKLGFRTDQATRAVTALQDAQLKLERRPLLPWFLLTEVASVTAEANEERVGLPSNFLREYEEDALWLFNTTATEPADEWTELIKDDLSVLRNAHPGTGDPIKYSLTGLYFRLFPTQTEDKTLKLIYYKQAEVLSTNIENEWLKYASDLMIGMAGKDVATVLRDADAIAVFKDMITEGQAQLIIDTEARQHENTRYIIGGLD